MAKRTVLEELVVVVTGNATSYHKMMANINRTAIATSARVQQAFTRMTRPITQAYDKALRHIRKSQIEFMAGIRNLPLMNAFGRSFAPSTIAGKIGAGFGRAFAQIRANAMSTRNAIIRAFTGSQFGRAMHNAMLGLTAGMTGRTRGGRPATWRSFSTLPAAIGFGAGSIVRGARTGIQNFAVGAQAAFLNRQGIGGRPFTGMSTTAGALGARVGALGALAYRPIGMAISAGAFALPILKRAGHNLSTGFMAGLQNRFPRFTTRMAQIGSLMGRGARGVGTGAMALGRGAIGAAPTLGAGVAAGFGGTMGAMRGGLGATAGLAGSVGGAFGGAASSIVAAGRTGAASFVRSMALIQASALRTANGIIKAFRRVGYDLEYIGRRLSLLLTLPIGIFGTLATKAFSRFDDAMAASSALLGGLSKSMRESMETVALGISGSTRTSPTDLALGYFQLASAGMSAAESMKALGTIEQFAVAGAFDITEAGMSAGSGMMVMGKATEYLIGVQTALGLRTRDATKDMLSMVHIGDVLTKANIIAQGRVEEFALALTNKGAAALRTVNKSIEEGVAVLAAYAAQNVKGAAAGEKLNIVLRDLQRASLRNASEWKRMNLSVFDTNGNMRHIADIIADLEKKFGGMSDAEKQATFMMLGFQDRSVAAIKQLIGMSGAIRLYEDQLKNADGTMQRVADVRLQSFASQMMMLRNQITRVSIGIGKTLVPVWMKLNSIVQKAVFAWEGMNEVYRKWIVFTALAAAAVGPLILLTGVMISTVSRLASSFASALYFGVALVAGPFTTMGRVLVSLTFETLKFAAAVTLAAGRLAVQLTSAVTGFALGAAVAMANALLAMATSLAQIVAIGGPIAGIVFAVGALGGAWLAVSVAVAGANAAFALASQLFGNIFTRVSALGPMFLGLISQVAHFAKSIKAPAGLIEALFEASQSASDFAKNFKKMIKEASLAYIGFMENFSENMNIMFNWFQRNGPAMFEQLSKAARVKFEDISHNMAVLFRSSGEVIGAFVDYAKVQFANMWIGFKNSARIALAQVILTIGDWALDAAKLFAAAFQPGAAIKIPGMLAGMKEFWNNLLTPENFTDPGDIAKRIKDLIGGVSGQMRNRKIGVQIPAMPAFNFGIKEKPGEPEAPEDMAAKMKGLIGGVAEAVDDARDDMEEPITVPFSTRGLDALVSGTAAAFRAIQEFKNAQEGGAPAAAKGFLASRQAKAASFVGGRADKKKAYEDMMKARREAFQASRQPRARSKFGKGAGVDAPPAAVEAAGGLAQAAPADEMGTLIALLERVAGATETTATAIEDGGLALGVTELGSV